MILNIKCHRFERPPYSIERKEMEKQLWRLTCVDGLTGIFNRRHFGEILDQEPKKISNKSYYQEVFTAMKKILIVDDRSEVRELVEATLEIEDYCILQADSGEKAIEMARREKPDLILMDIMMPGGMDGLEATRILKNDPATGKCPIIILTAKGQEYDRDEGKKAGADDYFVKPFSPLDLLRKVEEILGE